MRHMMLLPSITLVLMACQSDPGPGDTLTGTWVSSSAQLLATDQGLRYVGWCQAATFGPVILDATGKFHAQSTNFDQFGNVRSTPGATVEIDGTVSGGRALVLQLVYRSPSSPPSDPVTIRLTRGEAQAPPVCTA